MNRSTISLNKAPATELELFGRILPRAAAVRLRCLVCQRTERAGTIPALCVHCSSDPTATLCWVYSLAESAKEHLHETGAAWESAYASSPVQERFDAYRASQDATKKTQAETAARRGAVGPLASLIRLWLDYCQAETKSREIELWVSACEAVLI